MDFSEQRASAFAYWTIAVANDITGIIRLLQDRSVDILFYGEPGSDALSHDQEADRRLH